MRRTLQHLIAALLACTLFLSAPAHAYDRPGRTTTISVESDDPTLELGDNDGDYLPSDVSDGGRYVAFSSTREMVPGLVPSLGRDTYRRDVQAGITELVSFGVAGTPAIHDATKGTSPMPVSISGNGRFVAFESSATNLVPGDTNLSIDVFLADMKRRSIVRVSQTADGQETPVGALNSQPSISSNGRYVAFGSNASNLVPNDLNLSHDVFLYDRVARSMDRVSVADKAEANSDSFCPSLSADGRFVSFTSDASNLVEGDTNGWGDAFVRDRVERTTERVSLASDGSETLGAAQSGDCTSLSSSTISADGRFVVFFSNARNIVPQASGPQWGEIYIRDRTTGRTRRVSVNSSGELGDGTVLPGPAISGNGRFVTFLTHANNLSTKDTGSCEGCELLTAAGFTGDADAYIHDVATGYTEMVNVTDDASEGSRCDGVLESASAHDVVADATGRFISFSSCSNNLDSNDGGKSNGLEDVFVRDRGVSQGVGALGLHSTRSRVPTCVASMTCTAGTAAVVTDSHADAGLGGVGAEILGVGLVHRPELDDLYLRIDLDRLPRSAGSEAPPGNPAVLYTAALDAGGHRFEVRAGLIGAIPSFALFRCDQRCTHVSTLSGGYGTTGEEIVMSVPIARLNLRRGSVITDLEVSSALGSVATGGIHQLDSVRVR